MRFSFDIAHIREELNELPFRDGKREVFVGRISEMFEGECEEAIADHLRQCEQELRSHTLLLTRHRCDRDSLIVVQQLRALPADLSWMAEAVNWVSQITTIALEMVLPGLAGLWLDGQLGTRFLASVGFVLGVSLGMWHLIAMAKSSRNEIDRCGNRSCGSEEDQDEIAPDRPSRCPRWRLRFRALVSPRRKP